MKSSIEGLSHVLGDEALIALGIAIAAQEDGLAFTLVGGFHDFASGLDDEGGSFKNVRVLQAEAGGVHTAVVPAVQGQDGVSQTKLRPVVADKDLLKTEGGVKADGAAHVRGHQHEFDFLWAHLWSMRGNWLCVSEKTCLPPSYLWMWSAR